MRLHTNTLTATDVYVAVGGSVHERVRDEWRASGRLNVAEDGRLPGVSVDVTARGSRSHTRSLDVRLTGNGRSGGQWGTNRRVNTGTNGAGSDKSATWDEWGMFLARLFAADPDMVAGTVANPIYACAAHFHWATGSRFYSLTPDKQHRNHRWEYGGEAIAGGFTVSGCTGGPNPCGAYRRTLPYGGSWTTSPVSADVTGAHR